MKKEDTEGTAKKGVELVGSILGNDAMLAYEQTHYDGVMGNTIKAWNFISGNDFSNARVELNRAEERQRRAAEYFAALIKERETEIKEKSGDSALSVSKTMGSKETNNALKAAGFEQGKWKPYEGYVNPFTTYSYGLNLMISGKTKSDYSKAADAFKRVHSMTGSKTAKADMELARSLSKGASQSKLNNQVWVIFENGQSTVKQERRVDLPIFLFSDNVAYSGIALPQLKKRGTAFNSITVDGMNTDTISNMDQIIGAEFDTEFPYILAREVTRVTIKTIAQKQVSDDNQLLGSAIGLLQLATTGADIRTFSALPSEYQAARLETKNKQVEIKAGPFTLPVELDKNATQHIIYVKAASNDVAPLVKVVNI
ncbi:hypothetical protein [Vibrio sp. HDW18]|uniref:hypothetical protein n=1 Tax=Vibrio sp. HDW18 TaxID=2714948 RepID=UPI001F0EA2E1|nr:hypothetical protein [Vibrio sp. HDW18]